MVLGFYISLSSKIMWFYPISTIHFEEMHFGFKTCIPPFWSIGVNPSKMTIWNFSTSMPFCTKKNLWKLNKKKFSEKYKNILRKIITSTHSLSYSHSLTAPSGASADQGDGWQEGVQVHHHDRLYLFSVPKSW